MNRICEEQVEVKCVRCTFVKFLSDSSCCFCTTIPARKISITYNIAAAVRKLSLNFIINIWMKTDQITNIAMIIFYPCCHVKLPCTTFVCFVVSSVTLIGLHTWLHTVYFDRCKVVMFTFVATTSNFTVICIKIDWNSCSFAEWRTWCFWGSRNSDQKLKLLR